MSYALEWSPPAVVVGLVALAIVPPLAMIALMVVLLAAVAGLVALAGAVVAAPYLLARSVHRRRLVRSGVGQPHAGPTRTHFIPAPSEEM